MSQKEVNSMKLQMDLLLYLDKRRLLNKMKSDCEATLEQLTGEIIRQFPPIRYMLSIDVMHLLDFSSELGTFLLNEPLLWQRLCNEIFFACLKSIDNELNQLIGLSQIAAVIRLKSLPNSITTKQQKYKGIVTFLGLLIDISNPNNYVYHSVWSCPEQCEGNEVILHFIPKVPPKCSVCRSLLFENSGLRRCGDQVIAKFKLNNEPLCKKFLIQDDLIAVLKLGGVYQIQTVVLKNMTTVWSVEETFNLAAPISTPVPLDIKDLFSACSGRPWKFIYCLASTIGFNTAPLNCFMNIKINLLLSLTSVKSNIICGSTILHCLASGYDTGYVGRMMECAAQLAYRYVLLGTSNTSISTALVAASGGVCLMQMPFQAYSQRYSFLVLSTLEAGEINHNTSVVPLKCAVWAHGMDFKKIAFCNVSSVFRNVCRGDYGEYEDELAEHILQQAIIPVKSGQEELQALKDVSIYIDLVAGIKVTIHVEAENLLRLYFLAARKERPKTLTVGGMSALVAVCTMSAKLCRRTVANSDDAIFAIWLHVSGIPEPRFAPAEYLDTPADINKLENVFEQFQLWLENFIGCRIIYSQNT